MLMLQCLALLLPGDIWVLAQLTCPMCGRDGGVGKGVVPRRHRWGPGDLLQEKNAVGSGGTVAGVGHPSPPGELALGWTQGSPA